MGEPLKKYIQRLCRMLGDDAGNATWIKTINGVGYRFIAPAAPPVEVTPIAVAHQASPPNLRDHVQVDS